MQDRILSHRGQPLHKGCEDCFGNVVYTSCHFHVISSHHFHVTFVSLLCCVRVTFMSLSCHFASLSCHFRVTFVSLSCHFVSLSCHFRVTSLTPCDVDSTCGLSRYFFVTQRHFASISCHFRVTFVSLSCHFMTLSCHFVSLPCRFVPHTKTRLSLRPRYRYGYSLFGKCTRRAGDDKAHGAGGS